MASTLWRARWDRGLPVAGRARLRAAPLTLCRLGQDPTATRRDCSRPERCAAQRLGAGRSTGSHTDLTPGPPHGCLNRAAREFANGIPPLPDPLSVMSGKCRRNSTTPDSLPPSWQVWRIAQAAASSTANIAGAWTRLLARSKQPVVPPCPSEGMPGLEHLPRWRVMCSPKCRWKPCSSCGPLKPASPPLVDVPNMQ